MAEKVESISRRMITESDAEHSYWLPSFQNINSGVFRTKAYDENYRKYAISAPEDFASEVLYVNLQDASIGDLEIPEQLMVDQIEDWFVANAMKKGLELYAASQVLNERWSK
jgi:hypothetical protein